MPLVLVHDAEQKIMESTVYENCDQFCRGKIKYDINDNPITNAAGGGGYSGETGLPQECSNGCDEMQKATHRTHKRMTLEVPAGVGASHAEVRTRDVNVVVLDPEAVLEQSLPVLAAASDDANLAIGGASRRRLSKREHASRRLARLESRNDVYGRASNPKTFEYSVPDILDTRFGPDIDSASLSGVIAAIGGERMGEELQTPWRLFIIGENFIGKDSVCLILGDNIFYGQGFSTVLKNASLLSTGCSIFSYQVANPEDFGVIEVDEKGNPISIEEKPDNPKSNMAVTGLYFYDNDVVEIAKSVKPSKRGELEINSINERYLKRGDLNVQFLGRGFSWLDTGTHYSMLEASHFVHTMEKRQGIKIACLEEIAWRNGWVSSIQLNEYVAKNVKNDYFKYISMLTSDEQVMSDRN